MKIKIIIKRIHLFCVFLLCTLIINFFCINSKISAEENIKFQNASYIVPSVIIIYSLDQQIYNFIHTNNLNNNIIIKKTSDVGNFVGHPYFVLPILGAVYVYGNSQNNQQLTTLSSDCFMSLLYAGLITNSLKLAFHRHRPSSDNRFNQWDGPSFSFDEETNSFPSMHAATIFSIATMIAQRYPETNLLCYGTAALISFSRILGDYHWASDVFIGSAIGYFTAKWIASKNNTNNLKPSPVATFKGISFNYNFY